MHTVWVEVEVLPGELDAFLLAIASNAAASVRKEPGCYFFDVVELDAGARRYGFYEIYRDRDAFLVEHRSTAHYAAWKAAMSKTVVPGSQKVTEGFRLMGASSSVPDGSHRASQAETELSPGQSGAADFDD